MTIGQASPQIFGLKVTQLLEGHLKRSLWGQRARPKLFCMQGEDAIEDWEIWGDPREIERRKAERARALAPPEQRKQQVDSEFRQSASPCLCPDLAPLASFLTDTLSSSTHHQMALMVMHGSDAAAGAQVAEEWALAKGEAARAKASGDKARQKLAGQVIAGLKKETQQLGESLHPQEMPVHQAV